MREEQNDMISSLSVLLGLTIILMIVISTGYATPVQSEGSRSSESSPLKQVADNDESDPSSLLGWSLIGLAGMNICAPSGSADCEKNFPGVNLGLATEYRWRYYGVLLDYDWGTLTPIGTGSDQVTHRLQHIGLGSRLYYPKRVDRHYFLGGSLGWGKAVIADTQSEASVEWSSFWSNLRLDLGATWLYHRKIAMESILSMVFHLGGSRCILYKGAGPCEAVDALEEGRERSSARVLMLRFALKWIP